MANTFTQLYIQLVFSTMQRFSFIESDFKEDLHKYITGIIQKKGNKLLAINSMPDHIHIFIGLKPDISISDLVRDIKTSTSAMINQKRQIGLRFAWQEGYGAFSYSHSGIDNVIKYIMNQENHHRTTSFREEYMNLLKEFNINYDMKYLPGSSE